MLRGQFIMQVILWYNNHMESQHYDFVGKIHQWRFRCGTLGLNPLHAMY